MAEDLKIQADDHGHTYDPGLPGGEEPYEPPYVEDGGKVCEDEGYYVSVCETGFVDPVLRHTIVEASATLNDCQVCVTAAEVREAVDAIQELLELTDSEYHMSGGSQSNPGSEDYEDVTSWSEDNSNSDYSNASGTMTCNSGGRMSMSCGVGVRCSSGSSSCSVRLVRKNAGADSFTPVAGTETTEATSADETTVIGFNYSSGVNAGDQFVIQYRNEDGGNPHEIQTEDSFWDVSISSSDVGAFSGSTITPNTDLKTALQELETAVEAASGGSGTNLANTDLTADSDHNHNWDGYQLAIINLDSLTLDNATTKNRIYLGPSVAGLYTKSDTDFITVADVAGSSLARIKADEVIINSPDIILDDVLTLNNSATEILVRNTGTGELQYRAASTLETNWGNTDITATGDREHDFAGNGLEIVNVGFFELRSTSIILEDVFDNAISLYSDIVLNSGPGKDIKLLADTDLDISVGGDINIVNVPATDNSNTDVLTRNSSTGHLEIRAASTLINTGTTIKRLTSAVNSTSTTYAAITDLTFDVEAGISYGIRVVINAGTVPDSGIKITINGTATATTFFTAGAGINVVSTLGSDIVSRAIAGGNLAYIIDGFITVNAGGTLGLQFAQVDTDGGTTTISPGSYMRLTLTDN